VLRLQSILSALGAASRVEESIKQARAREIRTFKDPRAIGGCKATSDGFPRARHRRADAAGSVLHARRSRSHPPVDADKLIENAVDFCFLRRGRSWFVSRARAPATNSPSSMTGRRFRPTSCPGYSNHCSSTGRAGRQASFRFGACISCASSRNFTAALRSPRIAPDSAGCSLRREFVRSSRRPAAILRKCTELHIANKNFRLSCFLRSASTEVCNHPPSETISTSTLNQVAVPNLRAAIVGVF